MNWTKVEDGLPEAGFDILLVRVRGSELPAMAVFVGETIEGHWRVQPLFGNWFASNNVVTHWMPLPAAPKVESHPRIIVQLEGCQIDANESARRIAEDIREAIKP